MLLVATLIALLVFPTVSHAAKDISVPLDSYETWSEEAVEAFDRIMVQEGGRVKPMLTYSRFNMMKFLGGGTKTKFQTKDGVEHKIGSSEAMMDILFKGDRARFLPFFLVEDSAAVIQIGVSPKSKRDRYSYEELMPGRAKLAELAEKYRDKAKAHSQNKAVNPDLTLDEKMVLELGGAVSSFEFLLGQFGFARKGEMLVNEQILPDELKQLATKLDMAEMLDKMPEMTIDQLFQTIRSAAGGTEDEKMFSSAMRLFFFHANSGIGVNLIQPQDKETEKWVSVGEAMITGLEKKDNRPWAKEKMAATQKLVEAAKESDSAFVNVATEFYEGQKALAGQRNNEGKQTDREVKYYNAKYFSNSLVFFIIAFVTLALSWLSPGSGFGKWMQRITIALSVIGVLLLIWGITQRCLIRNRPPITNLYDTILFITATAVLFSLALEWFTRIGVGTMLAVFTGFVGMWLGITFEAKESSDTMGKLLAVLDTNFWLWTHVTIINIGYAAGLIAAFLGMVYLTGAFATRLMGKAKESRKFFKTLNRMTYGTVCFCLFFSLVGTVLGGIWANYSWGRFWGWDPKENGALMICLWSLVILHARMGGYIREVGINMQAIVLGVIVTFSWWGVNNLEVGLHSYGFTEGVERALHLSWSIMGLPFLLGVFLFFMDRSEKQAKLDAGRKDDLAAEGA